MALSSATPLASALAIVRLPSLTASSSPGRRGASSYPWEDSSMSSSIRAYTTSMRRT
ncbi:Uncharacterised protein [Mycobacterium tuberculosis]|nr:Uncharacterised protein [Mycobacterium tuberculosis]